ncbi:MAG: cytochrome c biogenesis protein CcdA [Deferribacterales bacterium]
MTDQLAGVITAGMVWAPFAAFLAGLLTSFTPCSLSAVPLIIGFMTGTGHKDTKRAFYISLVFALGTSLIYTALGIFAAYAGQLMGTSASWWYIALGVLMLAMAFQVLGFITVIPSKNFISRRLGKGYTGAFAAGCLAGLFSSPCSTPVLVVLLSIAVKDGNALHGGFLLFLYAFGHSILAIAAGTSVGFANRIINSENYGRLSIAMKYMTAGFILLLSFYMFYLGF